MPSPEVERYLRGLDAFARGDLEGWLQEAPDEWHTTGTFPGVEPVYTGREGMIALWEFMRGPWEMQAEVERIVEFEAGFVALLTTHVRGDSSGAAVDWKASHLVTYGDGVIRLKNFLTWEEGLEAAGVSSGRSGDSS